MVIAFFHAEIETYVTELVMMIDKQRLLAMLFYQIGADVNGKRGSTGATFGAHKRHNLATFA